MKRLVVTAIKLNQRKRIPESFPDDLGIVGKVHQGHEFLGEEVNGAEVLNAAMGKWYRDRDGSFYWGGGLAETAEIEIQSEVEFLEELAPVEIQFDPVKMSWGHDMYQIPFIWQDLKTKGKGVVVAVIDTGIDIDHDDLKENIHPLSKSFVSDPTDIDDVDTMHSHGTRMAGIIAGKGGKVFGIAPDAKVLVLKATLKKVSPNVLLFIDAVNFASTIPEVDIVSISYTISNNTNFKQAILNCHAKGKIVLAAIGNGRDTDLTEDPDTFPACYNSGNNQNFSEEILAIGSFNKQKKLSSFSNHNHHLSFISPGESILTTSRNNETHFEKGTSVATAFTAGCLALMVSFCKINNIPISKCSKTLLQSCDDMGEIIGHDVKSGFGYMNLRNAISKLKQ